MKLFQMLARLIRLLFFAGLLTAGLVLAGTGVLVVHVSKDLPNCLRR